MSLTIIWQNILNALIIKNRIHERELAELSNLSIQTLRKNIRILNRKLNNSAIIIESEKFYAIDIKNLEDFLIIMQGKFKKDTDFNSFGKRMAYIILRLLETNDYVIIDDLSEELNVSRSTVNNDIKRIKNKLKPYGVLVEGTTNKGMRIIAEELKLRLVMINYIYDYFSDKFKFSSDTREEAIKVSNYYRMDQATFNLFKKVISVSIYRIKNNKTIKEPVKYFKNIEYEKPILDNFIKYLESEFSIKVEDYDRDFISFPINTRTNNVLKYGSMDNDEDKIKEVFNKMMEEINKSFVISIDQKQLYEAMKYHLMFMMNRLIFHIDTQDLFMDEIKQKYPLSYELAKTGMKAVEEFLNQSIKDVEISYIAIYFELILQRNTDINRHKKVAIVSSSGLGAASLIQRQLKDLFGTDVQVIQYNERDYTMITNNISEYIAVFSTFPLENLKGIPVIQLANLFDNELMVKEWRKIRRQNLLNSDWVELSFEILDSSISYKKNVKNMINNLRETGKLSQSFLEIWKKREELSSSIFDNGLGFPHSINRNSNKIVISIGVFKEDLIENNQKVKIVFLVGVPDKTSDITENALMDIYDLVFSISQKSSFIELIRNCINKEDFLDLFLREEIL